MAARAEDCRPSVDRVRGDQLRSTANTGLSLTTVRLELFDLALQAHDETRLKQVLAELRRIEGEPGSRWRYAEALTWLQEVKDGKTEQIK